MDSPRTPFSKTTASALLDGVRAAAALVVCLSHWRNLFFVSFPLLQIPHKILLIPAYVVTGAGHQAVIVFFVLSGYLIAGSVFRMMDRGAWSWRQYLTHRLVRLWIVLLPALLLGGILDSIGFHSQHAPGLYTGHVQNNLQINVLLSLNFKTLIENAFFLQWIVGPTFGTNGPLWSLANEFWYYVLFPLAMVASHRSFSPAKRILSAVLCVVIGCFVGKGILLLFPIWLSGALLARIRLIPISRWSRLWTWVFYPIVFFGLAKAGLKWELLSDYVLGIATFVLVISLLNMTQRAPDAVWVKLARTSARFSYTLYLVHVPFLVLLAAFLVGDGRWSVTLTSVLAGLGVLVVAVIYAYAVACVTEFRTDGVRSWVEGMILPRRRLAQAGPKQTGPEQTSAADA